LLADPEIRGSERARILYELGRTRADDLEAMLALDREALGHTAGDEGFLWELHFELAAALLVLGRPREGLVHARAMEHLAARGGRAGREAITAAYVCFYERLLGTQPVLARALTLAEEARKGLSPYDPYRGWMEMSLGQCLMYQDALEEARERLTAARDDAIASGNEELHAYTLLFLAEVECRASRYRVAAAHAEEGYELALQTGHRQALSGELYVRAYAAAFAGQVAQARADASESVRLSRASKDEIFWIEGEMVLGFLELSLGNAETAAAHLQPLWPKLAAVGYADPSVYPVLPNAVEALVATGQLEEARTQLGQLEACGRALDSAWALAQAARCRALLAAAAGDLPVAGSHLERALAEHERLPMPFERARTLLVHGTVLRRQKRKREARDALQRALMCFEELGTPLWAEKARAELARIGGRQRAGGGGLTPTEHRVADLVCQGLSNKQIATTLVVSVGSVEAHLTRIYAKLQVHSRTGLMRVLPGVQEHD
jgi:ATP/maltotriose-dependent transcriptional regulator MalT